MYLKFEVDTFKTKVKVKNNIFLVKKNTKVNGEIILRLPEIRQSDKF
jgi:hypothetical protein